MCGIITAIQYDKRFDVKAKVLEQYEDQKGRGQDGFGFVAVSDEGITYSRSTNEKAIRAELDKVNDPWLLMFHHRIPTSSINSVPGNHPIFIHNKANLTHKYFLIHNGHINNSDELFDTKFKPMGFQIRSWGNWKYPAAPANEVHKAYTDSEALGVELALYVEGKTDIFRARGGTACFLLQVDDNNRPTKLFFFRNSNPINFYTNQFGDFYSSTGPGEELKSDNLFCHDFIENKITRNEIIYQHSLPVVQELPPPHTDNDNNTIVDDKIGNEIAAHISDALGRDRSRQAVQIYDILKRNRDINTITDPEEAKYADDMNQLTLDWDDTGILIKDTEWAIEEKEREVIRARQQQDGIYTEVVESELRDLKQRLKELNLKLLRIENEINIYA